MTATEKILVEVTYDASRGYVGSARDLRAPVVALRRAHQVLTEKRMSALRGRGLTPFRIVGPRNNDGSQVGASEPRRLKVTIVDVGRDAAF